MGLLSNPKQRKKLVDAIARYNNILCVVCYVVGVGWFMALAYRPLNAKTYFSENALLPGVVESGFHFDFDSAGYLSELKDKLKVDKRNVPRDWVYDKFQEIGLDVYRQNYSIKYPLNIVRNQLVPGQNIYAILRARRTASTEAIVISAPFRAKTSDLPQSYGGIILMLGLAQYFKRQPYWSKDIIFLVTDHEQIGMQAWLDGYHQVEAEYIRPGELPGRSGQIQAALNLEIPDGSIKYFNLKIEGLNGQLPNLDLVNLVVRLCRRHYSEIMIHNSQDVTDWEAESVDGFLHSASTMLKMMWAQASGLASGNHGMFHRYHIEAVTLEGVKKKKSGRVSLETTGRIVEGICRSLNNLLERFHQSFFFYILPGTERYISIGLYMIPFAIMCLPCLIKAVALWVSNNISKMSDKEEESQQEQETDGASGKDVDGANQKEVDGAGGDSNKKLNKETLKEIVEEEPDEGYLDDKPSGVVSILPLLFSSFLMSILCYIGPEMLSNMAVPFQMNIEDGVFFGFLALFTASLMFPRMVARKTSDDKRLVFDWMLLKSVTLIFQSIVLFSLSLLNISLAFFIGLVTVPVSVMIYPSQNCFNRMVQKLLLLLISPLSILFVAAVITSLQEGYSNSLDLLTRSWSSLSRGLLLSMVDKYFFGSWLFTLFSFTILPNWLTLWGISFCHAS